MGFRNYLRHFGLNYCDRKRLTSNLEVLKEVPTTNQPNESEIESGNPGIKKSQQITRNPSQEKLNKINMLFGSNPKLNALRNIVPASYLLQNPSTMKNKFRIFLIDEDVACDVLKVLHPHLETYNGHVMEIGAGAGVLTEVLLKSQLQNLRIYEPDSILCNHLLKLIDLYKSNARLFMADIQSLSDVIKSDSRDNGDRIETLFSGLPFLHWQDEPAVKLIGALPDERFIVHIMFSTTLQSGLCKYGRPELFVMFPPEHYEKLTSNPKKHKIYRSNSVAFQILFDHEELLRVPENAFVHWCAKPRQKNKAKQCEGTSEGLCLVKITPKRDLLQTISPNFLKTFLFFVKFMMHKKSALLIDLMEKWVPGCGVRLISKGYTIFTDCGSLTPEEYLQIYLEFTSWPEFYSSSFLPSAESLMGKLLQYDLAEEVISDSKFSRLLNKDTSITEEDEDVFDGSANLEDKNKSSDDQRYEIINPLSASEKCTDFVYRPALIRL